MSITLIETVLILGHHVLEALGPSVNPVSLAAFKKLRHLAGEGNQILADSIRGDSITQDCNTGNGGI